MEKDNNTVRRALLVHELVSKYYEPGNQRRSALAIYRNIVVKVYPMGESTFWRYLRIAKKTMEHEP